MKMASTRRHAAVTPSTAAVGASTRLASESRTSPSTSTKVTSQPWFTCEQCNSELKGEGKKVRLMLTCVHCARNKLAMPLASTVTEASNISELQKWPACVFECCDCILMKEVEQKAREEGHCSSQQARALRGRGGPETSEPGQGRPCGASSTAGETGEGKRKRATSAPRSRAGVWRGGPNLRTLWMAGRFWSTRSSARARRRPRDSSPGVNASLRHAPRRPDGVESDDRRAPSQVPRRSARPSSWIELI